MSPLDTGLARLAATALDLAESTWDAGLGLWSPYRASDLVRMFGVVSIVVTSVVNYWSVIDDACCFHGVRKG